MKNGKTLLAATLAATMLLTTACTPQTPASSTPSSQGSLSAAPQDAAKLSSITFMTKDYYTIPDI